MSWTQSNGSFATETPFVVRTRCVSGRSLKDESTIFGTYGREQVEVTDATARVVAKVALSSLADWWKYDGVSQKAAARGHVVHWPIARSDRYPDLTGTLSCVASYLSSRESSLTCLFDQYPFTRVPNFNWLIFGPSRFVVPAHRDMFATASWNLLISGEKTWKFWEPCIAEVDPDSPQIVFGQKRGDLVWIPERWWHEVQYSPPSICISKNLVLDRSLSQILAASASSAGHINHIIQAIQVIRSRERHQ